ncbi:hypothetical protein [Streptomyces yunnanensis]|uniref:Uncharacterized protein n=1 Tax=Streptomyces yunnanensis TaxID=156453 RepID=A0A9X8QXW1_9ACTN|nr:hypothetical protein [Streptomyces yunnanensis]SHM92622.1 hypothetical protein SAMN05216268_116112 [Streptomyces yunnanensis]
MRLPHLHLSTHHHQHDHPVRRTSDRLQFGVDALLALVLLLALPSAAIAAVADGHRSPQHPLCRIRTARPVTGRSRP